MLNLLSSRNIRNALLNNSDYQQRANMFVQKPRVPMKDYVQKIRNYTQVRSIKSLSQDQLFAVNDQSSKYYTQYQKNQEISKFEKQYFQYRAHKFTLINLIQKMLKTLRKPKFQSIKTTNPLIIVWNCVKIFIILHIFFLFPLLDSFGQEIDEFIHLQQPIFIMEWIILVFFYLTQVVDLFLRFNIQNSKKGVVLTQQKAIVQQYLRKGFLTNCLSIICFSVFLIIPTNQLRYLFYVKYKELYNFWKFVKEELDPQLRFKNHLELLKLLFIVVLLAHFFACIWIATGKSTDTNNWIESRGLQNSYWIEIYLNGLYFSITTMTTVGFGDITATNKSEVGVAICLILFSSCVFAFVFNTITSILQDLDQDKSKFKHDLQLIKNYMNKRGIDKGLQVKAQKYLRQIHKYGPSNSEQKVFKKLSREIQFELNEQDKGGLLLKQPFLVNNFSFKFLRDLTGKVKEINLQPEDKFNCQPGFYIIYKGEFQAQTIEDERVVGNLKPGDICGLKSLFNIGYKNIQIMSKTFSILYHVTQDDFMQILTEADLEQYYYILDKIKLNLFENLYEKCMLCQKKGHEICSEILYTPNKQLIIHRYLYTQDQIQKKMKRRPNRSRTFHQLQQLQKKAFVCSTNSMSNHMKFNQISEQSGSDEDEFTPKYPDSCDQIDQRYISLDENKKSINCEYIKQPITPRQIARGPSIIRLIQGFSAQKVWDDQFTMMPEFDRKKMYSMYFPSYNFDIRIRKINKIRKIKQRHSNQLFIGY